MWNVDILAHGNLIAHIGEVLVLCKEAQLFMQAYMLFCWYTTRYFIVVSHATNTRVWCNLN